MSGRTNRVIRLLALMASGEDFLGERAFSLYEELDADEFSEFYSCICGDYKLNSRGWEALRAYNERTGADVGEDCSAAGND